MCSWRSVWISFASSTHIQVLSSLIFWFPFKHWLLNKQLPKLLVPSDIIDTGECIHSKWKSVFFKLNLIQMKEQEPTIYSELTGSFAFKAVLNKVDQNLKGMTRLKNMYVLCTCCGIYWTSLFLQIIMYSNCSRCNYDLAKLHLVSCLVLLAQSSSWFLFICSLIWGKRTGTV